MKGQRLFVRETAAEDETALREFYASEGFEPGFDLARRGVIARLVGDLVAHMTWSPGGDDAVVTHVYVAKALRKKRVGRGLIMDAIVIARELGIRRLVVSGDCEAREFFLRMGFATTENDDEKLIREVT